MKKNQKKELLKDFYLEKEEIELLKYIESFNRQKAKLWYEKGLFH